MGHDTLYKVIVSDRARQMLAGHIRFLAKKSPVAAHSIKTELLNAIRSLSSMPERFPFLDRDYIPFNKYHKMVVAIRYLLLYQIKDSTVYVDFIVDCREDYGWLLR